MITAIILLSIICMGLTTCCWFLAQHIDQNRAMINVLRERVQVHGKWITTISDIITPALEKVIDQHDTTTLHTDEVSRTEG